MTAPEVVAEQLRVVRQWLGSLIQFIEQKYPERRNAYDLSTPFPSEDRRDIEFVHTNLITIIRALDPEHPKLVEAEERLREWLRLTA